MARNQLRNLSILVVATILVVAGAGWMVLRQPESKPSALGPQGAAFPGLGARFGDVAAVVVRDSKQATTVRIGPQGRWVVDDRAGFPADEDSIRRLLLGMASLKLIEARASSPDAHGRMGVSDTTKPDSTAIRIALMDSKNSEIAALMVGKTQTPEAGSRQAETFVRRANEDRAWLAQGKIDAKADPTTWLAKESVKLDRGRVSSVEFSKPEGPAGKIVRKDPKTEDFEAEGIPEGQKQNISNINAAAGALEFFAFADVAKLAAVEFKDAFTTTYRTIDGLVLTVRTTKIADKHWAAIAAAYDADQAAKAAGVAAKDGALRKAEDVEREAKEIAARVDGWAFHILDSKATDLTRTTFDFINKE